MSIDKNKVSESVDKSLREIEETPPIGFQMVVDAIKEEVEVTKVFDPQTEAVIAATSQEAAELASQTKTDDEGLGFISVPYKGEDITVMFHEKGYTDIV